MCFATVYSKLHRRSVHNTEGFSGRDDEGKCHYYYGLSGASQRVLYVFSCGEEEYHAVINEARIQQSVSFHNKLEGSIGTY